jgi:hypothetical protein
MHSHERVTLIARHSTKPDVDWNYDACARKLVAFVESMEALRFALNLAIDEVAIDIGRVIVDRAGDGDDFLDLLTHLPEAFTGDVVFVRDDGTGVISATGRGGDRMLYALTSHDVRFYFEAHGLVTGRIATRMTA